jgi:hypothetical protein
VPEQVQERSITECRHCGTDTGALCCPASIAYYQTQRYRLTPAMNAALDKLAP